MMQVFLEAMEGCRLCLSQFFVIKTGTFWVRTSTFVLIKANKYWLRRSPKDGCDAHSVGGCRLPFGGPFGQFRLFPGASRSDASMLLVLVGPLIGVLFPGWFHELVWQQLVLARQSSWSLS